MLPWPLPSMAVGSTWDCSPRPAAGAGGASWTVGELTIERLGGLGAFGLPGSRVRSHGVVAFESLSPADKAAVEALFRSGGAPAPANAPDAFRYHKTRQTAAGSETIEVPESMIPPVLLAALKDELL